VFGGAQLVSNAVRPHTSSTLDCGWMAVAIVSFGQYSVHDRPADHQDRLRKQVTQETPALRVDIQSHSWAHHLLKRCLGQRAGQSHDFGRSLVCQNLCGCTPYLTRPRFLHHTAPAFAQVAQYLSCCDLASHRDSIIHGGHMNATAGAVQSRRAAARSSPSRHGRELEPYKTCKRTCEKFGCLQLQTSLDCTQSVTARRGRVTRIRRATLNTTPTEWTCRTSA